MPEAAAALPGLLAGYLVRTTIVLALALLAAAAAKRRPAAFRHFVLSAALIGLLLLPVLSLAPIGWRSSVLPAWMSPAVPPATGAAANRSAGVPARPPVQAPLALIEANPGNASGRAAEISPAGPAAAASGPLARHKIELSSESGLTPLSGVHNLDTAASPSEVPSAVLGTVLAGLWAAGLLTLVIRLAAGLAGAVRLAAQGRALDGPVWRALLDRFMALVALRRPVRLETHPAVLVPLTWGFRKPIVLFPEGADAWSEDERSSALFHELSHISRADFLVMLLVRASLAVFWWNPLCWIVHRELRKEQEIACDELVLRAGIRPSTYAASLLAFRRSAGLRWSPSAALLGMLGRSSFQDRLAAILRQKITLMEVKMKTKIMAALALFAAVALIGTARPVSGPQTPETSTVLVETALPGAGPSAAVLPAASPVAQEKAQEQEKAKAAEKAKEAEKAAKAEAEKSVKTKTIVFKTKKDGGEPVEVVITRGDKAQTLVLEEPLTITKSKDGETLVLSVNGKEVKVLKGEPLRLEIKGGDLEVVGEDLPLKVKEGGVYRIVMKDGKEGPIIVAGKPAKEDAGALGIIVEDHPAGEKEKAVWVIEDRPFKEGLASRAKTFAFSARQDQEMLDKVRGLQEQVAAIKAKKMDLAALEESLKKLAAELEAKQDRFKDLELDLKLEKEKTGYAIAKTVAGEKLENKTFTWTTKSDEAMARAKARIFIGSDEKDGNTINMVFTGQSGEAGRDAYERALGKLKGAVPAGSEILETEYDAEDGHMTFKISVPEGQKTDKALVEKLVEIVKSEIDKK